MTYSPEPFDDAPLSAQGRRRRAEILRLAQGEARTRRRQRTVARAIVAATVVLAIALVWTYRPARPLAPQIAIRPPASRLSTAPAVPAVPSPTETVIHRIQTDPTLISQWSLPPQKPTWQVLNDDQLLRRLQEAGQPAGLAYIDGHARLLFRTPIP